MNVAHYATLDTADGPFTVITRDQDVIASGWTTDVDSLVALIHPAMRPEVADVRAAGPENIGMQAALAAVVAHYGGDVEAPRSIPVVQQSGPFREQAWEVLRGVAAGKPITYTEFADRAGRPAAVRAAAGACAQNAAALFVPCHRILRSDGSLGGFRYGLEIKQRLLDRERMAVGNEVGLEHGTGEPSLPSR